MTIKPKEIILLLESFLVQIGGFFMLILSQPEDSQPEFPHIIQVYMGANHEIYYLSFVWFVMG